MPKVQQANPPIQGGKALGYRGRAVLAAVVGDDNLPFVVLFAKIGNDLGEAVGQAGLLVVGGDDER